MSPLFLERIFAPFKSTSSHGIYLDDDVETAQEVFDFVSTCFDNILNTCEDYKRTLIVRDYAIIPEMLPLSKVKKELAGMVSHNECTKGYVNVWISSGRVLNWCIDHKKNRV